MKKSFFLLFFTLLFSGSIFAQYTTYRIEEGETLSKIADKFKVSKDAIKKLNPDLKESDLANKTIIIPPREATEKTEKASRIRFKEYRVKPKETLYSLAKRNNVEVEDIKKYNPYLYDEELGENDMIKIPVYESEIENFNTSLQTSTFENIIHIVLPKETKYGIAKKYGISVEDLDSLNPMIKDLKPGQFLKVKNPKAVKKEKESKFEYYKVKPKETLYSLTKELDISTDSLEKLNPILKELGLQAGMELRVPIDMGEDFEESLDEKIDLSKNIKNRREQNIAIFLPFNLNQFEELKKKAEEKKKEKDEDDEDEEDEETQEDLLKKDAYLQIALDLYSGMKIALDSADRMGISVKTKVYDTQRNEAKIDEILKNNNFKDTKIIIGPLISSHIEKVAKHLRSQETAIFSPLTSSELSGSDKIFQSRPSAVIKEEVLANYLKSNQEDKNLLILGSSSRSSFTNKLSAELSNLRSITQANKDYLQRSDLEKMLDKEKPNWVIIETDDLGAINNAISNLNAIRSKYEIRIFTSDLSKINAAEVESEYLSHLNFTYTSVDRSKSD